MKKREMRTCSAEAIQELVKELGSYTAVADILGLSATAIGRAVATGQATMVHEVAAQGILAKRQARDARPGKSELFIARVETVEQKSMLRAFCRGLNLKTLEIVE